MLKLRPACVPCARRPVACSARAASASLTCRASPQLHATRRSFAPRHLPVHGAARSTQAGARAANSHGRRVRCVHVTAAAVAEPGVTPRPRSMLPYYVTFLVFGCAVNTIGPMLPSLAAHIGLSPVAMAPLLSAKGAGGLAGSFLCPLLPMVRGAWLQVRCLLR